MANETEQERGKSAASDTRQMNRRPPATHKFLRGWREITRHPELDKPRKAPRPHIG